MPLIECLLDAVAPSQQLLSLTSVCPPSSCLFTHREGRVFAPLQAAEEANANAIVHATALMRSFEHQRRAVAFGGGWVDTYQHAYLCRCKGRGTFT